MQSVSKWLAAANDEVIVRENLIEQIRENTQEDPIRILTKSPLEVLIRSALTTPEIMSFCQNPACDRLWQAHLNVYESTKFFTPMSYRPFNVFTMLLGAFFYAQAMKARKNNDQYSEVELGYLRIGAANHHFQSSVELVSSELRNYQDAPTFFGNSNAVLQPALRAAANHWTPGYLLLAETYYKLANSTGNDFFSAQGLIALLVAKHLSQHSESKRAIYNAYKGQGIVATYQFKTWQEAMHKMIENASLSKPQIEQCFTTAKKLAQKYHTEIPSETIHEEQQSNVTLTS